MRRDPDLKDLLQKFSEGHCTAAEERLLRQWLERAGRQQATEMLPEEEKQCLLRDLRQSNRFAAGPVEMEEGRGKEEAGKWRRLVAVAAVLTGVVFFSWLLLKDKGLPAAGQTRLIQVATLGGEVKRIVLPDSSVIWLNANTQLAYDADFLHHRLIRLNGEALFEVTMDKTHPFVVRTQDSLETEVLGTVFDIRSYQRLPATRVTVLSGKVAVTHPALHLSMGTLTKDQSIRFERAGGSFTRISEQDAGRWASWREGQWELRDQGIEELGLLLFNHFGITLVNRRKETAPLKLDANFNRQQSAEEIISTFSLLSHCRYRWVNAKTVELY